MLDTAGEQDPMVVQIIGHGNDIDVVLPLALRLKHALENDFDEMLHHEELREVVRALTDTIHGEGILGRLNTQFCQIISGRNFTYQEFLDCRRTLENLLGELFLRVRH